MQGCQTQGFGGAGCAGCWVLGVGEEGAAIATWGEGSAAYLGLTIFRCWSCVHNRTLMLRSPELPFNLLSRPPRGIDCSWREFAIRSSFLDQPGHPFLSINLSNLAIGESVRKVTRVKVSPHSFTYGGTTYPITPMAARRSPSLLF